MQGVLSSQEALLRRLEELEGMGESMIPAFKYSRDENENKTLAL